MERNRSNSVGARRSSEESGRGTSRSGAEAPPVERNRPNSVGARRSSEESGHSRAGGGRTASDVAPAASDMA